MKLAVGSIVRKNTKDATQVCTESSQRSYKNVLLTFFIKCYNLNVIQMADGFDLRSSDGYKM